MSEFVAEDRDRRDRAATRAWVEAQLADGGRVTGDTRLRGGFTADMRRLSIEGPDGPGELVLRSFVRPFYLRHAEGLLSREAAILTRLAADGTGVPAATLRGVDATGEFCDHPSLLMTVLPGAVRVDGERLDERCRLLAEQLVRIHGLDVPEDERPRDYQAWVTAEGVRRPERSARPGVWERAVEVIRRPPPPFRGRFLHRDYHPGNVLFGTEEDGEALRITGVVDWVETSWGPADLDVAHCSTALALLHGVPAGLEFADRYRAAGGELAADPADHLYWRLLDALAFAPDAEKVGVSWRDLGRADLTAALLTARLEEYIEELLRRYG
ncbi:aminoglycoside phosphotransferase family protein [Kitasatospora sp. NPDC047058]|uniref:phosphotransferase family protein n=1 Tax=Kitasatospora sp. NPDC047058 TaxID=3155620 RepID=UPI003404BA84